jgi:hypothetical protein
MTTFSEVGHARNVANFEDLISYCTGYGATYNPVLNAIKIASMNTLKNSANAAIINVSTTFTAFKIASNNREIIFLPLKKLTTRIMAALKASGVSEQTVNDAHTINNKLQGKRARPVVVAKDNINQDKTVDPNGPSVSVPKLISVSQQSFDSQIEYFGKLIDLLTAIPAYNPNEADLKLPALNAVLANMKASNTAVITATTNYSNARIARTKLLYASVTGLIDVAAECKSYVMSVFGARSLEYQQVNHVSFKKQR